MSEIQHWIQKKYEARAQVQRLLREGKLRPEQVAAAAAVQVD